jgi:hypothetical protein
MSSPLFNPREIIASLLDCEFLELRKALQERGITKARVRQAKIEYGGRIDFKPKEAFADYSDGQCRHLITELEKRINLLKRKKELKEEEIRKNNKK